MTSSKQGGDAIFPGSGPAYGASREPDRWLVTINGRTATRYDMRSLNQPTLADYLHDYGTCRLANEHSEFGAVDLAIGFHSMAAREFPEDAVCLWTSVESTSER